MVTVSSYPAAEEEVTVTDAAAEEVTEQSLTVPAGAGGLRRLAAILWVKPVLGELGVGIEGVSWELAG
jgi:hypothetical protein